MRTVLRPAHSARRVRTAWLCAGLILAAGAVGLSAVGPPVLAAEEETAAHGIEVALDHGLLRLQVRDAPLDDVLRVIADQAGFRLKLKGDVSAPVTWHFAGVPLEEGLRRLAGRYGVVLNYATGDDGPGDPELAEVIVLGTPNGRVATYVPKVPLAPLERVYEGLETRDRLSRLKLVRTMASPEDDPAIADLVTILADEDDTVVRRMAVIALGKIGGEAALDVLAAALDDPDPVIRRQAVRALALLGEAADAALLGALKDDQAPVRVQAARALATMRSDEVVYALRDLLIDDPEPAVRLRAVLSLEQQDSALARTALGYAVDDPDTAVKEAAARALGERVL